MQVAPKRQVNFVIAVHQGFYLHQMNIWLLAAVLSLPDEQYSWRYPWNSWYLVKCGRSWWTLSGDWRDNLGSKWSMYMWVCCLIHILIFSYLYLMWSDSSALNVYYCPLAKERQHFPWALWYQWRLRAVRQPRLTRRCSPISGYKHWDQNLYHLSCWCS